jgi:uncharacterized membrane protein YciS (DUF1049 family)
MIVFFIFMLVAVSTLIIVIFLLGFDLGGQHWQSELSRVRLEAAHAERQLHNLTRQAFVSMAEAVERQHPHLDR